MSATRGVINLAKRNGGLFEAHEAIAIGMSRTTLQRRVNDGIFVRIGRGLYALPGIATRPDLAMRAAAKSLNAVVSHESAARIHGLEPVPKKGAPTVTVSHRGTHKFPGVIVHQSTDLLDQHIEEKDGLRLTTPARTVADLAAVFGRNRLERLTEHALVTGKIDPEKLLSLVLALSRQGKTGMGRLRSILDELLGTAMSETEIERLLFQLIRDADLPLPSKQFHARWLKPLNGRVDFAYVGANIVIEADSRRWHGPFDAFESDRIRDNAAQIEGWIVLRITWRMITDNPSQVVETIRSALELRRHEVLR